MEPGTNYVDQEHDMESKQRQVSKPTTNISWTDMLLIEVIRKHDPRYSSSKSQEEIKEPTEELLERKSFAFLRLVDINIHANILGGRTIMLTKKTSTPKERYKSRFFIQVHKHKAKSFLVRTLKIMRYRNLRLMVTLSRAIRFKIWAPTIDLSVH